MKYVGSIDQGTTSSRFIIFDENGSIVDSQQIEHQQILPQAGWVEHNPREIIENVRSCIAQCVEKAGIGYENLSAIGITNQRETIVAWDKLTGEPLYNAFVWQDLRTQEFFETLSESDSEYIRHTSGLALSPYFSGSKAGWLIKNVPAVKDALTKNRLCIGTIDSWLLWNLTRMQNGTIGTNSDGVFATDVTNASRTMLMNIETCAWDEKLCEILGVPVSALPEIRTSSEIYGVVALDGVNVPIAALIGDQQGAMVGHTCFDVGDSKTTYGTGNFALVNTGQSLVRSRAGLLTTVCYQFAGQPVTYALEGSVAVTGSAVQWLRDQLGIISRSDEIESLASSVADNGGVYFVPAFSGLYAPHWRSDARGVIVGLTRAATKAHLARACLEAICYQTREILDAMVVDTGVAIKNMRVDGGITANETCMKLQAEIMNLPLTLPIIAETTALGAAYCAGLAVGVWSSPDDLRALGKSGRSISPRQDTDLATAGFERWKKAVTRTLDWA